MMFKRIIFIFIVCVFGYSSVPVRAETINVSVAASLTDAFRSLAQAFKHAHPDIVLQYNFASSGALARQIVQGAPADIYVSANTRWMEYLINLQKIDTSSVRVFVHNRLVFAGVQNSLVQSINDVAKLNRIALGSPGSVPAGQYAMQALQAAGLYDGLLSKHKLIMAKDVRQALLYADRGEADGAFVYKTDALLAKKAVVLFSVPSTLYDRIAYPLALTSTGKTKKEAKMVYGFLNGKEALAVLESFGFQAPEE